MTLTTRRIPYLILLRFYKHSQGFIHDFHQEGANVAIVKLGGGQGPYCIFRMCWSGNLNNYSNKGGLGVLPLENFEICDNI